MNPLSFVSVASPPASPPVAALTSYMASTLDQWGHLIATVQQDLLGAYQTLIAQEASPIEQQVDHLLGINPTSPSPLHNTTPTRTSSNSDTGSGRGSGSGSGSGNGKTASAHSDPNQSLNNPTKQSGSGSGSGSNAMTTSSHVSAHQQGSIKMQPMTSGSGSGTVSGQVWLDNNGDGYKDNGESGLPGVTVYLYYNGSAAGVATTDSNGDYQFTGVSSGSGYYISVYPSSLDAYPTFETPDNDLEEDGFSPGFTVAAGENTVINAGFASMDVTTTADDPNGAIAGKITLRDAIETGNNRNFGGETSSTVTFQYNANQGGDTLTGTITLQKALPAITANYNIDGTGASKLAVSGDNSFRVFAVQATSTISGLTIENGYSQSGGGVFNSGTLTLTSDYVVNNDPNNGGGIFNTKGKLNLTSVDVNNNTATGLGGGLYNGGGGVVTISASEFYNNRANSGGGIFNANGSTLDIKNDTKIDYNIVTADGGGINNTLGKVTMTGGSIYENSGSAGGGIYTVGGNVSLTYVYLFSNFAKTGSGGGIFDNGSVLLKGGTVQGNTAKSGQGGGIYLMSGTLSLFAGGTGDVTIGGGNTAKTGGGLYLASGKTNLGGVTVSGNTATTKAAGVAYTTKAKLNPPVPIPAAVLTDNDDPKGQPVLV